jgi:iron complex outermembrane recepter protein
MGTTFARVCAMPAILLASSLATWAAAAESSSGPPAESDQLTEILVTAERRVESLQNVPLSITAFDANTIELAHMTEAKDYLQYSPNVVFTEDGQVGARSISIAIRGVGNMNIADEPQAASIGFYIDDLNVGAVASGQINPDLTDVEGIEVLRGPQGTYFGRNAIGGALNIQTKKPDATTYFETGGGYGNFDTWNAYAVGNVPLNDQLFIRAVESYSSTNGFIRNVNPMGTSCSCDTDEHARFAVRYLATDRLTLDLGLSYTDEHTGLDDTVASGVIDGDTKQTLGLPNNFGAFSQGIGFYPQNQTLVNLNTPEYTDNLVEYVDGRITYKGDGFSLESITGDVYSTNDRQFDEDQIAANLFIRVNRWVTKSFNQELRAQSDGSGRWDWTAGLVYGRDDQLEYNNIFTGGATGYTDPTTGINYQFLPPLPPGFPLNEDNQQLITKSTAAYGEGTYKMTDQWALTFGGRYTHDEVTTSQYGVFAFGSPVPNASGSNGFNNFSPHVTLKYSINPNVSTYASVLEGYRAGGVDINSGIITTFKPETVRDYELGEKSTLADGHLRINADVFLLKWTDLQVQTDYLANSNISSSVEKTLNASSAKSLGAELEVQAIPVRGLQLGLSAGYLDAYFNDFPNAIVHGGYEVNLTGQQLPKSPRFTASTNMQFSQPVAADTEAYLRVEGVYRSAMAGNIDATAAPLDGQGTYPYIEPSYVVWNLRLGATTSHFTTQAYSENVFNHSYYNGTYDHFGLGGIRLVPHPRLFGVRFSYKTK